jgi:hypothetical protein
MVGAVKEEKWCYAEKPDLKLRLRSPSLLPRDFLIVLWR